MEQIEKNHEQLSRSHAKLKRETKSIQEHNEVLTESLQSLVEKCDLYKSEMEVLKRENSQLQRKLSSASLPETAPESDPKPCEKVENNIQDLSVVIKELKFEQDLEKSMREELENELSQLIFENQNLEHKLRLFAKSNRNSFVEEQKMEHVEESNGVEEDVPDGVEEDGDCSNESFVLVEEQRIEELDSEPSLEQCDISFLDELDQQYRDLVGKYNSLVEKCKTEGIPYESREMCTVQRGVQTSHEEAALCDKEAVGCGVGAVPQYKQMFARLYEKIREGRDDS
ncbi:girdin-like [Dendronephthya gigantea]|nr:girdin-like [Dendronephthya gigantea]XP_028406765.1 girdin-like [Dendronephthya gigantea]